MIRTPRWDITIDGDSIDNWGLRPLMSTLSFDSEVGKFDTMSVEFVNGRELADAHTLLKHGAVVELFMGYVGGSYSRMMLGFIKGVQIKGSSRSVVLKVAGYLAGLGRGEKERTLGGKTIVQAVNIILADYEALTAGTIMNGDQLVNDDMSQSGQSDLEYLEGIAEQFGMFLKLEPNELDGVWNISMYELGYAAEEHPKPLVMNPRHNEQDPDRFAQLEEFDPESNILGKDPNVTVVSVNPIYRTSTSWVAPDIGDDDASKHTGGIGETGFLDFVPEGDYTDPNSPSTSYVIPPNYPLGASEVFGGLALHDDDTPDENDVINPYQTVYYQDALFDIADGFTPDNPSGGSENLVPVQTRTVSGSYVQFECWGGTSRVEFTENVSSEEAQRRIAEAIVSGEGLNFVTVKGAKLNEGDADLMIGQRRAVALNSYPLFGDVFSNVYLITRVSHVIDRSSGFETTFDANSNSLTIPPRPVPMTSGAFLEDGPVWAIHPGQTVGLLQMSTLVAQVVRDEAGRIVYDYSAQVQSLAPAQTALQERYEVPDLIDNQSYASCYPALDSGSFQWQ